MFPNFWSHSLFARFRGSAQLRGSLCIGIPMQACTQWTHSDVWSQLATTPECWFKVGGRQSEKKRRSEGDIQLDAWYWRRARSNPPPECHWRLWRSASTLTQPVRPDGNVFCWLAFGRSWWSWMNWHNRDGRMQPTTSVNEIRSTEQPNWVFRLSFNLNQMMTLWHLHQQHLESLWRGLTLSLEYHKCREGLFDQDVVIFG